MALNPRTTLGPYQIVAPIGQGGMGEVYTATDTRLDRYSGDQGATGGVGLRSRPPRTLRA